MNSVSLCTVVCALAAIIAAIPLFQAFPARSAETDLEMDYTVPHNLSPDERKWYETFQKGNSLADGWLEISRDILSRLPADMRQEQKNNLRQLGDKIGREWCKDNRVRKIDTGMLKQWGKQLREASKKSPERLVGALAGINLQVDRLLL